MVIRIVAVHRDSLGRLTHVRLVDGRLLSMAEAADMAVQLVTAQWPHESRVVIVQTSTGERRIASAAGVAPVDGLPSLPEDDPGLWALLEVGEQRLRADTEARDARKAAKEASSTSSSSLRCDSRLDQHLDDLELSVCALNLAANRGLVTLRDLIRATDAGILRTDSFGCKSLAEFRVMISTLFGCTWEEARVHLLAEEASAETTSRDDEGVPPLARSEEHPAGTR